MFCVFAVLPAVAVALTTSVTPILYMPVLLQVLYRGPDAPRELKRLEIEIKEQLKSEAPKLRDRDPKDVKQHKSHCVDAALRILCYANQTDCEGKANNETIRGYYAGSILLQVRMGLVVGVPAEEAAGLSQHAAAVATAGMAQEGEQQQQQHNDKVG